MNSESKRLESFAFWPREFFIKPQDLAAAGFMYLNIGVRAMCVFCYKVVDEWKETPICSHFEQCPLLAGESCNIKIPAHHEMGHVLDRLATIPDMDQTTAVTIAQCGLFLNNNKIMCFYCGKDVPCYNPIKQHYKLNCEHLRTFTRRDLSAKQLSDWKQYMRLKLNKAHTVIRQTHTEDKISECIICMTWPALKAFVPCGHVVTCVDCCYDLEECPICVSDIVGYTTIRSCSPYTLSKCVMCFDKIAKTMFFPCGHVATCSNCSPQFENCPRCNCEVSNCVNIIL